MKLAQLSGTRWLSIYDCCVRFLGQWDELKLHFQSCKNAKRCYEAELLYQMYCDPINKLYLQFLMPILQEFSRVNKLFQLEIGNAFKMLDCLQTFFRPLVSKILTPNAIPPSDLRLIDVNLDDTRNHMPLSVVTFGVQFTIALGEANVDSALEMGMKTRCRDFSFRVCETGSEQAARQHEPLEVHGSVQPISDAISEQATAIHRRSFKAVYWRFRKAGHPISGCTLP